MESHGDLECAHTSKGLSGGQSGLGRTPCDLRTQDARLVGSGHEAISHWPPYLPWEAVRQFSPRLPGSAKEWGLLDHPCCPLPPNTGAACSHAQLHSSLGCRLPHGHLPLWFQRCSFCYVDKDHGKLAPSAYFLSLPG